MLLCETIIRSSPVIRGAKSGLKTCNPLTSIAHRNLWTYLLLSRKQVSSVDPKNSRKIHTIFFTNCFAENSTNSNFARMKTGFDHEKYLRIQSERIKERIAKFGDKLYLEFGGKLMNDFHAARCLPGYDRTSFYPVFSS